MAKNHQQGSEAGWDVVGDVVDMRCPTAEVTVAVGLIANHGVEGVDHLIGQHARDSQEHVPEEWGNDAIREVLGKGLQGGSAYLLGRELGGVAPYNAGYLLTAFVERTVKGKEYLAHLMDECGASEAEEDDDYVEDNA